MASTRNDKDKDLDWVPRPTDDTYATDIVDVRKSSHNISEIGIDPDEQILGTRADVTAPPDVLDKNLDAIRDIRRQQFGREAAEIAVKTEADGQGLLPFDK